MSINNIQGIGSINSINKPAPIGKKDDTGFEKNIKDIIRSVNEVDKHTDALVKESFSAEGVDTAGMMISAIKAELSMQLTLQIRNKLVESYNEIIKMQM